MSAILAQFGGRFRASKNKRKGYRQKAWRMRASVRTSRGAESCRGPLRDSSSCTSPGLQQRTECLAPPVQCPIPVARPSLHYTPNMPRSTTHIKSAQSGSQALHPHGPRQETTVKVTASLLPTRASCQCLSPSPPSLLL